MLLSYSIDSSKLTVHHDLPNEPAYWNALAQTPTGFYGLLTDPAIYGNASAFMYNYDGQFTISPSNYFTGDLILASDKHLYVATRDTDVQRANIFKFMADEPNRDAETIHTFPVRGY